jgi:hypothetical protein
MSQVLAGMVGVVEVVEVAGVVVELRMQLILLAFLLMALPKSAAALAAEASATDAADVLVDILGRWKGVAILLLLCPLTFGNCLFLFQARHIMCGEKRRTSSPHYVWRRKREKRITYRTHYSLPFTFSHSIALWSSRKLTIRFAKGING